MTAKPGENSISYSNTTSNTTSNSNITEDRSQDSARRNPDNDLGRETSNYLLAIGSRLASLRKHTYYKRIIVLLILIFLLLMIILLILHYESRKPKICITLQCVRSASELIQSMDQNVDPCKNFYQYACGNWEKVHPKPEHSPINSWPIIKQELIHRKIREVLSSDISKNESETSKNAKIMFKDCLDTEKLEELGLEPIIEFLKSVNLPVIPTILNYTTNEDDYHFDWLLTITMIKKRLDMDILVGFDIYPDPKNTSIRRILLRDPIEKDPFLGFDKYDDTESITKSDTWSYIEDHSEYTISENYTRHDNTTDEETTDDERMNRRQESMEYLIMKKYLKHYFRNESDEDEITYLADDAMRKYTKFYVTKSQIYKDVKSVSDPELHLVKYNVDEFQNMTNSFLLTKHVDKLLIWIPYLELMFKESNIVFDPGNDDILLFKEDYLMRTAYLIQTTPPEILELYIWMKVINVFTPLTVKSFRDMLDAHKRSWTEIETSPPHSIMCTKIISGSMDVALAHQVISQEYFNATIKKIELMIKNMKKGFYELIKSSLWMDVTTKMASTDKIKNMKNYVAYPSWVFNEKEVAKYYRGVNVTSGKFVRSLIMIKETFFMKELNKFREKFSLEWGVNLFDLNAHHKLYINTNIIPYTLLEHPFYDLGLKVLNYGVLGSILGHKFTHALDNKGRYFDENGALKSHWSNDSIESYSIKSKCFIKEYSSLSIKEIGVNVDGERTLAENIADNGGLRLALHALWREPRERYVLPGLSHLSIDQLFFLSYANSQCKTQSVRSLMNDYRSNRPPNQSRVNGTLQNMPEFTKAWKCRSKIPIKKKCIIY